MSENSYIGRCIGNYRIVALLGSGGFGSVYRGVHTILTDRTVAIKILHTYLDSATDCNRFLQEASLLERMHHPHILHILDAGIDNRVPYLVVELALNGSVRDLIKRYAPNVLPIETSLSILSQIGQALEYAHQQNIVHRDLKPENILFDAKGAAILADFGIATQLTTNSIKHVTVTGTPSYMAPEQFQGSASKESDQYALACIAYELFTGKVPFAAPDFFALGFKHLTEMVIVPTQLNPALPVGIEVAILKAMSKQRGDRYADIGAFVTAMQSAYIQIPSFSQASISDALAPDLYRRDEPQMIQQTAQEISSSSAQGPVTPLPSTPTLQNTEGDERSYTDAQLSLLTTLGHDRNDSQSIQEPLTQLPTREEEVPLPYDLNPRSETGQSFPINGGAWNGGIVYSERKRDSGRRWTIATIAGVVVTMAIVASLLFVFLPSALLSHTNSKTAYAPLQIPTMATRATTTRSTPGSVSHPTPTIVPNNNSNAQTTPGITPAPTLTPSPTASHVISETLQVYFNNSNANGTGISTQHTYNGNIGITISGVGQAYSTAWSDAFYIYTDKGGNLLATPYTDIRWLLYINGNPASDSVGLPAYNSSHYYTVSMSLSQPSTINFGIRDSINSDNTGSYTITVQQL